MNKKTILLLAIFLVAAFSVMAHKNAPETADSTYDFYFAFGLVPQMVVVGEEQELYVRSEIYQDRTGENYYDRTPYDNIQVEIVIYKNRPDRIIKGHEYYLLGSDLLVAEYDAVQTRPGYYSAYHTFEEVGGYTVLSKIYQKPSYPNKPELVKVMSSMIHVEPKGASKAFWAFMLVSIVIGMFVASKSHEIL